MEHECPVPHPMMLAFAGGIGSGKSTLSSGVANALGWPRTSFGSYVRTVAVDRGLDPRVREVLQEVGAALAALGWEPFCRVVLEQAGWLPEQPLVVDGVRHMEALRALRALAAPLPVALVYIAVDEADHIARLQAGGIDDPERQRRVEAHSTEVQVATALPALADLTVDGSRPAADTIAEIVRWVLGRDP